MNRRDHSIDWTWRAVNGYPDQFARDRLVMLERNASFAAGDSGYSSWDQMADGTIVAVDYTCGDPGEAASDLAILPDPPGYAVKHPSDDDRATPGYSSLILEKTLMALPLRDSGSATRRPCSFNGGV